MDTPQDDSDYLAWVVFVKEALSCLNKKNYTWVHLPCAGGLYDQDNLIMSIWNVIADEHYYARIDPVMAKYFGKEE